MIFIFFRRRRRRVFRPSFPSIASLPLSLSLFSEPLDGSVHARRGELLLRLCPPRGREKKERETEREKRMRAAISMLRGGGQSNHFSLRPRPPSKTSRLLSRTSPPPRFPPLPPSKKKTAHRRPRRGHGRGGRPLPLRRRPRLLLDRPPVRRRLVGFRTPQEIARRREGARRRGLGREPRPASPRVAPGPAGAAGGGLRAGVPQPSGPRRGL